MGSCWSSKQGCVFPMVIWPAFRMGQYRVDDHLYHAPQFSMARVVTRSSLETKTCVEMKICARKIPREYIFMRFAISDGNFDRAIQPCVKTKGLKFRQKNDGFIDLDVHTSTGGTFA